VTWGRPREWHVSRAATTAEGEQQLAAIEHVAVVVAEHRQQHLAVERAVQRMPLLPALRAE